MLRVVFVLLLAMVPGLMAQEPLTRIAFGSCADQEKPLPIFQKIADLKPQLYIALGDNMYADIKPEPGLDPVASMKVKYEKMAQVEGWKRLIATCPMLGTWDDHDYGKNDAGVEYPHKVESQQLLLDFFKVPADSPLRKQQGVYQSRVFGPEGKRVQVILLDMRYFRTALKKDTKVIPGTRIRPYLPVTDAGATYLGDAQWKWLEAQLKVPAEVRLIGSSIQLISEDHPHEKWANIPAERDRLYKLLRDTKATGVVVLSGDRHLAELSMDRKPLGYPLYDITSSGLNQGDKKWRAPEANTKRVASMAHGDNFGFITIDWSAAGSPRIALQVRDVDGEIAFKETVPLALLRPGGDVVDLPHTPGEGAVSPRDARTMVGKKVVVEMKVQATGQAKSGSRLFLNSETDFRNELNFTVVVNPPARTGKYEKATVDTFKDKVIRVTGTVSEFRGSPQIEVNEEGQLTVLK